MKYSDKILSTITKKNISMETIKCLMLQSTGEINNTAVNFYDNLDSESGKRYAHYVVDGNETYKYAYTGVSVLLNETIESFTGNIKKLTTDEKLDGDSPAKHIVVLEICKSDSYENIEKQAIKFCAEFLNKYGLTTDNLWRIDDVILDEHSSNSKIAQYAKVDMWNKFISAVNKYIEEMKKEGSDPFNSIVPTGTVIPTEDVPYESDKRSIGELKSVDADKLSEEDFTKKELNNVTSTTDNFTKETKTDIGSGVNFDPIYPDLTLPPRSSTSLYDEKLDSTASNLYTNKPVLGKIVNDRDPYPVDDKIAELEIHRPIIHIDSLPSSDIASVSAYLVELSQRTEKRIVQLENVMSTAFRYLWRIGSRMNINCVYYGGQSVYDKYKCIRCMHDDLINDGAIVSLDQCLNCSRYEPVLGQVYDILDEDMKLTLAPILDDIQASRMTNEGYKEFSRIEKIASQNKNPKVDLTKLKDNLKEDKTFGELWEKDSQFKMDWTEVGFEEASKADINEYEYDREAIFKDKDERLKAVNKYKDGYSDIKKKTIVIPADSYESGNGITSGSSAALEGALTFIDSYDYSKAVERKNIVDTARKMVALCKAGKGFYSPQDIPEKYMNPQFPPDKLAAEMGVIQADCSEFVEYCFRSNGVSFPDYTQNQYNFLLKNGTLVGTKRNLQASIKEATPGDIVMFGDESYVSHVGIYVGEGKMCHSGHHHEDDQTKDWAEIPIYSNGFFCIMSPNLPKPTKATGLIKYAVKMTITEMAKIQLPSSTDISGNDYAYCKSIDQVIPYLDPLRHMSGDAVFQFLNLGAPAGAKPEQLKAVLVSNGAHRNLIDNAAAFIEAGKKYNLNEVYLMAHLGLETGWGNSSTLTKGTEFNGRTVYNMYGIAAYNNDPSRYHAKKFAYDHGWFTPEAAIIGGAEYVRGDFIGKGQITLYHMRWNPLNPKTHHYATGIAWATAQASTIGSVYRKYMPDIIPKLQFLIPEYNK